MKKKVTKKKTAMEPRMTPLAVEHDLSVFADSEDDRYALSQVKYDANEKCLVATDGRICAVVPLDAGPQDMLIAADALSRAMCEATPGHLAGIKQADGTVTVESDAGRTVRDAGEQGGKWPSWRVLFSLYVPTATMFSVAPRLLKALAEYAIACEQDSIDIGFAVNEHAVVDTGIHWRVGETVGVLMPRGKDDLEPEELSQQLRARMTTALEALRGEET